MPPKNIVTMVRQMLELGAVVRVPGVTHAQFAGTTVTTVLALINIIYNNCSKSAKGGRHALCDNFGPMTAPAILRHLLINVKIILMYLDGH